MGQRERERLSASWLSVSSVSCKAYSDGSRRNKLVRTRHRSARGRADSCVCSSADCAYFLRIGACVVLTVHNLNMRVMLAITYVYPFPLKVG